MSLTLRNIEKAYAAFPALNGVSLEARPGEFLALLGPSGSGKTTLLRVIAGLEKPEVGAVDFDGEDFLALTARERRIGFVFQNYALFRHMSVAQNIAFGLSVRPRGNRPSKAEQAATVERLLALVQLEGLGKRYPDQLSGGQRQRVALARALAIEPRMLLLDEPFGALDAVVRRDLRRWLRKIHDESGVTTIFVTHDQQEAMDVADRVAVLNRGRIEQIGAPRALYDAPASAFVMTFLGEATCMRGEVKGGRAIAPGINLPVANPSPDLKTANLYFRPHDVKLSDFGPGIAATLVSARLSSGMVRLELTLPDGGLLEADTPRDRIDSGALTPGATIHVEPTRVYAFADAA